MIEAEILKQVAAILKVPVEAIKNFDEQAAIVYFNTFNDSCFTSSNGVFSPYQCTFNAMETVLQLVEENRKLYERLLTTEKEKSALLERMVGKA